MHKFISDQVRLAVVEQIHVATTYGWVCSAELQNAFLMRGQPTREIHDSYFERVLADPSQRVFVILQNGVHVGNCGFKHLNETDGEGEAWIYIGEANARSRGAASAALEKLLDYGWRKLNLTKISVHVAEDNLPARKLYRRCGFVEQGNAGGEWADRGSSTILIMRAVKSK